jgi:hypothetical protein
MRKIELDFARSMKLTSVKNSVLVLRIQIEQRHGDHDQDDRQERLLE